MKNIIKELDKFWIKKLDNFFMLNIIIKNMINNFLSIIRNYN